jgi:pilus assembly protein CpaE
MLVLMVTTQAPSVLLALSEIADPYREALTRAGFTLTDEMPADLVVLDADLPAATATSLRTRLEAGGAGLLLLVGEETPDWALAPGGAAHVEVALKPLLPGMLVSQLQAMLIRRGGTAPDPGARASAADGGGTTIGEGRVITVFAPKGGVGKTMLAVNLAVALREQTRASVLLIDAAAGVGNLTDYLEVPVRMGLADLADLPPEQWTDAAFELATAVHPENGVRVLTWGQDPAYAERVSVDLLLAATGWARRHASHVVIDTQPGYDDRTLAMLTVANEILLVVTPEVGALRNAAQFLKVAGDLGLRDVVRVVVNRANHGIDATDIVAALGMPISASVVSDGRRAVLASNEGVAVISRFPRERIAADLHGVARVVLHPETTSAAERARGWPPSVTARAGTS